ncbi:MAG: hypothetical protein IT208_03285 [Chthonomonadales bacterium]|nr:hypothetical protein [Chthonomonadales bacterium]
MRAAPSMRLAGCGAALLAALAAAAVPTLSWRSVQMARTACLSNQRRLGTALLLYSQDHDWRLPPAERCIEGGIWLTWDALARPYLSGEPATHCPANPPMGAVDPYYGYAVGTSYALNARFGGFFSQAPYPLENLELPEQTVLLAEGGAYRPRGPFGRPAGPWALIWYWDTAWWPNVYASPHHRRMNVAAADGHVVSVEVAHYGRPGHDPVYGRLGRRLYNWNGGHPNGRTADPPRE